MCLVTSSVAMFYRLQFLKFLIFLRPKLNVIYLKYKRHESLAHKINKSLWNNCKTLKGRSLHWPISLHCHCWSSSVFILNHFCEKKYKFWLCIRIKKELFAMMNAITDLKGPKKVVFFYIMITAYHRFWKLMWDSKGLWAIVCEYPQNSLRIKLSTFLYYLHTIK